MKETTVAASLAIDMLRYLERHGHAIADSCRAAGLDPSLIERPDERIPGSRMAALWHVAVEATGDPLVAVHMAEAFHPAALDILGYVVATCRTVGDVLACLARFAGLLNDGMRIVLAPDGPRVVVRLEIVVAARLNVLQTDARHVVDSMWIGLARQLRSLPVRPVVPLAVSFRHTVADDREYRRLLGAPVTFGAADDRMVLRRDDLAQPLPSANPALFAVFERHAHALLDALGTHDSMVSRVARAVAPRVTGRVPPISEVARALAMSARNLQRALQAEQTTYQQVLDDVRRGLAERYLADETNSVSQVALLLGFSEAAAFHRAFKRWTGATPAQARRRDGRGPSPP